MALESGTYVKDLVSTNPPGTDVISQGDDHIRLVKSVLKNSFPSNSNAPIIPNVSGNGDKLFTNDGTDTSWTSTITGVELKDYSETVNVLGSGGGTRTIDFSLGNVVTATVSTSTNTFSFTNPPASGKAGSFTLLLTNGGSQTVNWPASVKWPAGVSPVLTTSGVDWLGFTTVDGGTTWYGVSNMDLK